MLERNQIVRGILHMTRPFFSVSLDDGTICQVLNKNWALTKAAVGPYQEGKTYDFMVINPRTKNPNQPPLVSHSAWLQKMTLDFIEFNVPHDCFVVTLIPDRHTDEHVVRLAETGFLGAVPRLNMSWRKDFQIPDRGTVLQVTKIIGSKLSVKHTTPIPHELREGTIHHGTVCNLVDYGVFVELEEFNATVLVHRSTDNYFRPNLGERVLVRIIQVKDDRQLSAEMYGRSSFHDLAQSFDQGETE